MLTRSARHSLHARCWMLILPSLELRKHVNSQNKCCFLFNSRGFFLQSNLQKHYTDLTRQTKIPQSTKIKREQNFFFFLKKEEYNISWGGLAIHIKTLANASFAWPQAKTNNWGEKEKASLTVSISLVFREGSVTGRQHFCPAINNHREKHTLSS